MWEENTSFLITAAGISGRLWLTWCEISESNVWMSEWAAAELSLKGGLLLSWILIFRNKSGVPQANTGSVEVRSYVSHTYASCLRGTWSRRYRTVQLKMTPEAGAESRVKIRQSSLHLVSLDFICLPNFFWTSPNFSATFPQNCY